MAFFGATQDFTDNYGRWVTIPHLELPPVRMFVPREEYGVHPSFTTYWSGGLALRTLHEFVANLFRAYGRSLTCECEVWSSEDFEPGSFGYTSLDRLWGYVSENAMGHPTSFKFRDAEQRDLVYLWGDICSGKESPRNSKCGEVGIKVRIDDFMTDAFHRSVVALFKRTCWPQQPEPVVNDLFNQILSKLQTSVASLAELSPSS
jgi:hypothetical protein